jgi:hypothetical protein
VMTPERLCVGAVAFAHHSQLSPVLMPSTSVITDAPKSS